MELFAKLGIDWRLLIAQLVNFVILFTALTFLLYKPLIAALDKRRAKIAESLANAEKIGDELKRANASPSGSSPPPAPRASGSLRKPRSRRKRRVLRLLKRPAPRSRGSSPRAKPSWARNAMP